MDKPEYDKEFERKVTEVRTEIITLLEKRGLGIVPQLHITQEGIRPVIAFIPVPEKSVIEVPKQGIEIPK